MAPGIAEVWGRLPRSDVWEMASPSTSDVSKFPGMRRAGIWTQPSPGAGLALAPLPASLYHMQ